MQPSLKRELQIYAHILEIASRRYYEIEIRSVRKSKGESSIERECYLMCFCLKRKYYLRPSDPVAFLLNSCQTKTKLLNIGAYQSQAWRLNTQNTESDDMSFFQSNAMECTEEKATTHISHIYDLLIFRHYLLCDIFVLKNYFRRQF